MRTVLVIAAFLGLVLLSLGFAEQPKPRYTTLVIEYQGKTDRPIFPIVISTSLEEGERYKQKLFQEPISTFVHVHIVPASTLSEIAELPLLRSGLERPNPATESEASKTAPTVRFVAGAGHEYAETILDAQASMKVLLDIDKQIAKFPELENQLQDIETPIKWWVTHHTPSRR